MSGGYFAWWLLSSGYICPGLYFLIPDYTHTLVIVIRSTRLLGTLFLLKVNFDHKKKLLRFVKNLPFTSKSYIVTTSLELLCSSI